jgi:hypothetical protein
MNYIRESLSRFISVRCPFAGEVSGTIQIVRGQHVCRFVMASNRQIQANRENAKKSCGPRTPEGKRVSRMNAVKAGLFAKHLLLPDDDGDEFSRLRVEIHREWEPVGRTETSLVERLVALLWRQRRIYRAESGLFTMYRQCPEGVGGVATALARDGHDTEAFTRVLRMDAAIERSMGATIRLLQKLQEDRSKRTGLTVAMPGADSGRPPLKEELPSPHS